MSGRVAILGWGSLLWDPDGLPTSGAWKRGGGPRLPLEFSRVSRKRHGALTLVIDRAHGVPCATSAIASARSSVEAARADLAARERCAEDRIGAVCARRGVLAAAEEATGAAALLWARTAGAAGAVWTDLPRSFEAAAGRPFSVAAALGWLQSLDARGLSEAVAYVDRAPPETDTPLRRALADDPWWRGLPRPASAERSAGA